jgi:hypothetical protein
MNYICVPLKLDKCMLYIALISNDILVTVCPDKGVTFTENTPCLLSKQCTILSSKFWLTWKKEYLKNFICCDG